VNARALPPPAATTAAPSPAGADGAPAPIRAAAVVIGASAGGVEALLHVLGGLPRGYRVPVLVVLHLPPDRDSVLAEVLAQRLAVPVLEARDKLPLVPGTVHVAPGGYHLLVESDGTLALNCDAPELYSRPSINVLMDSAADCWGPALLGVLLTGANEDGGQGMAHIHRAGGATVVQDPAEALADAMPLAALALHQPTHILTLAGIRALLSTLEPRDA